MIRRADLIAQQLVDLVKGCALQVISMQSNRHVEGRLVERRLQLCTHLDKRTSEKVHYKRYDKTHEDSQQCRELRWSPKGLVYAPSAPSNSDEDRLR